jgi:hypothetical protein
VIDTDAASTYYPDTDSVARSGLDVAFRASRLALTTQALAACERAMGRAHMDEATRGIFSPLSASLPERSDLIEDPAFAVWASVLYQAMAREKPHLAVQHLENLPGLLHRVTERMSGGSIRYIPGTAIALQREDLDPYIMAVTPPSYDFTAKPTHATGHSLDLQAELVGLAIENAGACWPDERDEICSLVKVIGYLPDATFRSCSAARYQGVVYLGNQEDSILDIEESLVHEAGHQRLYRLSEVTPVTLANAPKTPDFVLPWSGQQRDLFGFLHATYIYLLLVKYYLRRRDIRERDASNCQQRAELIFLGLLMALPALRDASHLTPRGNSLVHALSDEAQKMRSELSGA